jgi:hypothetical protein
VLGDKRDRAPRGLGRRIQPEDLQRLQGVHRRGPGLPRLAAAIGSGEARPAGPQPVGILEREQAGTPAFVFDPRPLGGNLIGPAVREVAQHLPTNGRIRVE